MIGLNFVYPVAGLAFGSYAVLGVRERRWANAGFHGLLALSFLAGSWLGDLANGVLVLGLVALAAMGRMKRGDRGEASAPPRGLLPLVFVIPAVAVIGTLAFRWMSAWVDPKQATLVALTSGALIALALAYLKLRPSPLAPFQAGRALADDIGWAIVMPQMLASLGAIFALAGVGKVVGGLAGGAIPAGSVIGAVLVYALGMALFTIVMGNAFAAFPVMATGIGVPLLIQHYHAHPAPIAAIGMLAGFCGTLLTPMAANFNLVPAALLELRDRYGVIRAQVATAVPLLAFNILLLWWVIP